MKRMMMVVVGLWLVFCVPALAQERLTEHTVTLGPGKTAARAPISEMEWLAGWWSGEGLGGRTEEVWTAPEGGAMVGMFRFVRDGKPVFYEILTLRESDEGMSIRLKHVNPDMTGWEEKEKFVEFRYVGLIDGVHHFSGLAFRREGNDAMTIYLALRAKDGTMTEHVFRMTRSK
ncbi:MAG TPA: DUF6265 family protein [Thermoanaerobaculia bacterium]|nr:DUF6265 family protein [Thermoanaerobaculia bacterium]